MVVCFHFFLIAIGSLWLSRQIHRQVFIPSYFNKTYSMTVGSSLSVMTCVPNESLIPFPSNYISPDPTTTPHDTAVHNHRTSYNFPPCLLRSLNSCMLFSSA